MEFGRDVEMGKFTPGSLISYPDQLKGQHDDHNPVVGCHHTFLGQVRCKPSHGPYKAYCGNEKLGWFYPGIDAQHLCLRRADHDEADKCTDQTYPAKNVEREIAGREFSE